MEATRVASEDPISDTSADSPEGRHLQAVPRAEAIFHRPRRYSTSTTTRNPTSL